MFISSHITFFSSPIVSAESTVDQVDDDRTAIGRPTDTTGIQADNNNNHSFRIDIGDNNITSNNNRGDKLIDNAAAAAADHDSALHNCSIATMSSLMSDTEYHSGDVSGIDGGSDVIDASTERADNADIVSKYSTAEHSNGFRADCDPAPTTDRGESALIYDDIDARTNVGQSIPPIADNATMTIETLDAAVSSNVSAVAARTENNAATADANGNTLKSLDHTTFSTASVDDIILIAPLHDATIKPQPSVAVLLSNVTAAVVLPHPSRHHQQLRRELLSSPPPPPPTRRPAGVGESTPSPAPAAASKRSQQHQHSLKSAPLIESALLLRGLASNMADTPPAMVGVNVQREDALVDSTDGATDAVVAVASDGFPGQESTQQGEYNIL